jgi:hypothetical protein
MARRTTHHSGRHQFDEVTTGLVSHNTFYLSEYAGSGAGTPSNPQSLTQGHIDDLESDAPEDGALVVVDGFFTASEALTVSLDGVNIVGNSRETDSDVTTRKGSTLKFDSGLTSTALLELSGRAPFVRDVQIHANNADAARTLWSSASQGHTRVYRVVIREAAGHGIRFNGGSYLVDDCDIYGYNANCDIGILATNSASDGTIRSCQIGGAPVGIRLDGGNTTMFGCKLFECGQGLLAEGVKTKLYGTRANDCDNEGVLINGVSDCILVGVQAYQNGQNATDKTGSGIRLGTSTDCTVIACQAFDSQSTATQEYGLHQDGGAAENIIDITGYGNKQALAVRREECVVNGAGIETANAEKPQSSFWEPGHMVEFGDTGDGSGDGVYLLADDGSTWLQLASTSTV